MGLFAWIASLFKKKPTTIVVPNIPAVNVITTGGNKVNKYALLVGINKYQEPGNDLQGCVNDVMDMAELLTSEYGFNKDDIRILTDARATQQNILERLEWLVSDTKPGDLLVFHYSGHGAQIRDRKGDELDDHMTEILCPHDLDWDNPFTDDMMAGIIKKTPEGSLFEFFSDSCHSKTQDRGMSQNPHYKKAKRIIPPPDIAWRGQGRGLKVKKFGTKGFNSTESGNVHITDLKDVLLSGCRDEQTSADAFFDGRYNGALTYYLCKSLRKHPASRVENHANVLKGLISGQYDQVTQLSGSSVNINKAPFTL